MINPLKQFKAKKKRAVDPNAPPRPTLLGHEKTIKDISSKNKYLEDEVRRLSKDVDNMRSKMVQFQQYLDQVHVILSQKKK